VVSVQQKARRERRRPSVARAAAEEHARRAKEIDPDR
jgi:hypothetical protein